MKISDRIENRLPSRRRRELSFLLRKERYDSRDQYVISYSTANRGPEQLQSTYSTILLRILELRKCVIYGCVIIYFDSEMPHVKFYSFSKRKVEQDQSMYGKMTAL